jgi:asparagine N-glycosylation enzyme membrane subunit Stt3
MEEIYSNADLEKRKKKLYSYFKQKKEWIYYLILAAIVFIGTWIRTLNIPRLKDVTNGAWILGPDLDPFLFLRWAEYIVDHGKLMVIDTMRNVPLGFNTAGEMKLLSYLIAWVHNFLSFFGATESVTHSAIIFPVIMFGLTIIAFFLFARKIFYRESEKIKNIIALIATAFFILIPSLIPRTIAGIPEKESAAFFFMFMAFYFFLEAMTSKNNKKGIIFSILAGIFTAGMGLIWGGIIFIFFTIPTAILFSFLLGKIKKRGLLLYLYWILTSLILMMPFSTRYTLKNLLMSTSTGLAMGVFALIGISLIFMKFNLFEERRKKMKLPKEFFYIILAGILLLICITIIFGPSFVVSQVSGIKQSLITPITTRFGLTVAENKQPYFINDWKNSFGPVKYNIPLFFWLFFSGAVVLFCSLIKKLKLKEKVLLTIAYFILIYGMIFSRYSPSSKLNGVSGLSLTVYFGAILIFLICFGYYYFKKYREGSFSDFKAFDFSYILYFLILTLGIIGARGGIRLIMVLGAVSPIAVSFLIVKSSEKFIRTKDETLKLILGVLVLIIIVASLITLFTYYKQDKATSENFAPGYYQFQWQKAMSWVRENTQEDAVFAHWWDYGYWLQSMGQRATILDGGNMIVYWNHLLGRHVLTGTDENLALEFLYTHKGTHLLIDSTEIGKYTAYSSIGSDENYDRFSWITTFLQDGRQTVETAEATIYFYGGGGFSLDEDITWDFGGGEILLPKRSAGVGGIFVKQNSKGEFLQPEAVIVYNKQQYKIPLRYLYLEGEKHDFGTGLEAGVFIFSSLDQTSTGTSINSLGAAMYFSEKTVNSNMVQLYLFGKNSPNFELVHTEDSLFVENLKQQNATDKDFIYYQGLQGPIKIWKINYPSNIQANPDYLETVYPNQELNMAKPGEY